MLYIFSFFHQWYKIFGYKTKKKQLFNFFYISLYHSNGWRIYRRINNSTNWFLWKYLLISKLILSPNLFYTKYGCLISIQRISNTVLELTALKLIQVHEAKIREFALIPFRYLRVNSEKIRESVYLFLIWKT